MENKKEVSKKIITISIVIAIAVLGIVAIAVGIQSSKPTNIEEVELDGGTVSLTYADDANLFAIENATPTSDVTGMKFDSAELFFDFTVTTEIIDAESIQYDIVLVKDDSVSTSLNENIKVYLEKESDGTYSKVIEPVVFINNLTDEEITSDAMSLYTAEKSENTNDNYRLRMWVSDTAVFNSNDSQNFGVKIALKARAE